MGKAITRGYTKIISNTPDRHANKMDIVFCKDNFYHINFRNIQFKLNKEEFDEWRDAFKIAKEKLKGKMENDI